MGYRGPTVGLALGLRKGQAQNFITLKKRAYNVSSETCLKCKKKINKPNYIKVQ